MNLSFPEFLSGEREMGERIIVLGGGVIGLSCALECRLRGWEVVVIEKGRCGGQASGAAAGMLAPYSENTEQPDAFFQFCHESLGMYECWLEKIREFSAVDVEWERTGSLHVVYHEADLQPLANRLHWQRAAGARAELVDAAAIRRLEPAVTQEAVGGILYPEEAHLYAPAYVRALEEACRRSGVLIIEGAGDVAVKEWEQNIVLEGSGMPSKLYGERLMLCTGAWSGNWQELFGVRWPVFPIRGQICAYPLKVGEIRHMVFTNQGYVVGKRNGMLVCGASEDVTGFETSVTEKGVNRLIRWSRQLLPALKGREPHHAWAGLRPATQDGFPLLGPLLGAERVICAFGHYRNGILLSPATAQLAADWAEGREALPYAEAFDPLRFT